MSWLLHECLISHRDVRSDRDLWAKLSVAILVAKFVMPGQTKTRVDKNSYSLEQKGVNETSRELEAKRKRECQLQSIAIKRLSRFKLFKIQKDENDANCGNSNETTTAISHLHFISSSYSSLECTWVSTKQAKWEQGDLNFCGRSIPFLFRYYLVHMKIRSNWGKRSTG